MSNKNINRNKNNNRRDNENINNDIVTEEKVEESVIKDEPKEVIEEVKEDKPIEINNNKNNDSEEKILKLQKEIDMLKRDIQKCYDPIKLGILDCKIKDKMKEITKIKNSMTDLSKYSSTPQDLNIKDRRNMKFGSKVDTITISSR